MNKLLIFLASIMATCCVHHPQITSEITSYGSIPEGSNSKKLGVFWNIDKELSAEERMTLNSIAQKMVDEARIQGIDAYLIKTSDDYKRLESDHGLLAYPVYTVNEKSKYHPPETSTYTVPQIHTQTGSVSDTSGNTYNYSGYTTTYEEHTVTSSGYVETYYCRNLTIKYFAFTEILKEAPEPGYLQKIESCGSNNDIRIVVGEMLESAFLHFGKEGQFNETIYTDVPRNSSERYAH